MTTPYQAYMDMVKEANALTRALQAGKVSPETVVARMGTRVNKVTGQAEQFLHPNQLSPIAHGATDLRPDAMRLNGNWGQAMPHMQTLDNVAEGPLRAIKDIRRTYTPAGTGQASLYQQPGHQYMPSTMPGVGQHRVDAGAFQHGTAADPDLERTLGFNGQHRRNVEQGPAAFAHPEPVAQPGPQAPAQPTQRINPITRRQPTVAPQQRPVAPPTPQPPNQQRQRGPRQPQAPGAQQQQAQPQAQPQAHPQGRTQYAQPFTDREIAKGGLVVGGAGLGLGATAFMGNNRPTPDVSNYSRGY